MGDTPIYDELTGPTDPGHLLPPDEWARVQREAAAVAGAQQLKTERGRQLRLRGIRAPTLARSSFPSVTGFVQCKYDGGAQPGPVTFGVLHDAETPLAAGYAASISSYFTRNTNQTSAHFMVGPDAAIQLLDTGRVAWHCGNGNTRSVGVEQAGYAAFTAAQWATPDGLKQMARVAAVMRDLKAAHGIGLYWMTDAQLRDAHAGKIAGGWATHDQCSRVLGGSTHTDPTPNYPQAQLMALANQEDDMPTAQEVADAILNSDINGVRLRDRLYGMDAIQLPGLAKTLGGVADKVLTDFTLAGRPAERPDDLLGHILSTEARVVALAGQVTGGTAGGTAVIDYAKLAAAIADELDRRARDGNPATGPAS